MAFSVGGKRFEMELDNEFAAYVHEEFVKSEIAFDRDNESFKLLKAYMTALKRNYDDEKQVEALLMQIST